MLSITCQIDDGDKASFTRIQIMITSTLVLSLIELLALTNTPIPYLKRIDRLRPYYMRKWYGTRRPYSRLDEESLPSHNEYQLRSVRFPQIPLGWLAFAELSAITLVVYSIVELLNSDTFDHPEQQDSSADVSRPVMMTTDAFVLQVLAFFCHVGVFFTALWHTLSRKVNNWSSLEI
ncbi:hypothetical protein N0V83_006209 [Neocucurbitaria cava]|uniref:Uncharacterized protein n=1 Tax=Neocucurbitaria cava TaxID=798079 RepID=A0A9W8Y6K4_9PLEO|nr:hypothetical protein N0V83_006209 [Neocucurbitaria cava]